MLDAVGVWLITCHLSRVVLPRRDRGICAEKPLESWGRTVTLVTPTNVVVVTVEAQHSEAFGVVGAGSGCFEGQCWFASIVVIISTGQALMADGGGTSRRIL